MTVLALEIPDSVWVAIAGAIAAVGYYIRKQAAKTPSSGEQAMTLALEVLRETHRAVRRIEDIIVVNPPCQFSEGKIPDQLRTHLQSMSDKQRIERLEDERRKSKGSHQT